MVASGKDGKTFLKEKIQEKADQKKAETIQEYENKGFLKVNEKGGIHYADTRNLLENAEGETLTYLTRDIKGAMNANQTDMTTLSGHDLKVRTGVSGEYTTNFREATFGLSENANYNSDWLYNAKAHFGDSMNDKTVANVSTAIGNVSTGAQYVAAARFMFKGAK